MKLNKYIFLLCTKCKKMVITPRSKDDIKKTILMTMDGCDSCSPNDFEGDTRYYDLYGQVDN